MTVGRRVARGEQPLRAFVSSVIAGLEHARATVADVVREREMEPWVFENTGAHSGGLEVSYLDQVADSDFVIWLEAGVTTEPVENEIRRALASRRCRLLVFRLPRTQEDERTRALMSDVRRGVKYVDVDESSLAQAVRVSLDDELARAVRAERPPDRFALPKSDDLRGRDADITRARQALRSGSSVAISGLGGVGKTALAIAVANELEAPGRALFVSLRGLQDRPADPYEVAGEVLEALGLTSSEVPEEADARAQLWRSTSVQREPVIVFDDARDEAQVRPLMPSGGVVIVTSRATLTGIDATLVRLDVLDEGAATNLIADAAGEARVGREAGAASELAALCGHLPLALRIVGRRLASRPAWSLDDLARRLRDEVRRLDELQAGDVAVRAAFNLSYRQLDDADAAVFRLLGLFRGGQVDAAAIHAVAEGSGEETLERLVDLGLLESLGVTRYAVHDLLRIFAAEQFRSERPDTQLDALTRLAAYYASAANERADALHSADEAELRDALSWFDGEWPTIIGITEDLDGTDDHEALDALADALTRLAARRRHWAEWEKICRATLASAERAGDLHAEGRARQNLGIALLEQDRPADAKVQFERALEIARVRGDQVAQARATAQLGSSAKRADDPKTAVALLRDAVNLYANAGDEVGRARALGDLGNALDDLGDLDGSIDAHRAALAAFGDDGYLYEAALEHGNLGLALAANGDLDGAEDAARSACDLFERVDDQSMAAKAKVQLAGYLFKGDSFEASAEIADEAVSMCDVAGDVAGQAAAIAARARARIAMGRDADGVADHDLAADLFARANRPAAQADHLAQYANALRELGEFSRSVTLFDQAAQVAQRSGLTVLKARIAVAQAELDEYLRGAAAGERRLVAEAEEANARGDTAAAVVALVALAGMHATWGERGLWRQRRDEARALGAELADVDREPPNVRASHANDDERRSLARMVVDAVVWLDIDLGGIEIDVIGSDAARDESRRDWELTDDGFALQRWLLELPDPRAHVRLAATAHGALVSYLLKDVVDIQQPLGETLHEVARSWTLQRRFVIEGGLDEESPMVPSLENPQGLEVARVVGAAGAGNSVAQRNLERWRESLATPDGLRLTDALGELLALVETPAQMLQAAAAMYQSVADSDTTSK